MTLAVARKVDSLALLVADTHIDDPLIDPPQFDQGLKIFAIECNAMLAYSGSPQLAHKSIAEFFREKRSGVIGSVSEFFKAQSQAHELDFLIVEDGRIDVIRSGVVDVDLNSGWIGSIDAFEAFQKNFSSSPAPDPASAGSVFAYRVPDKIAEMLPATSNPSDPNGKTSLRESMILAMEGAAQVCKPSHIRPPIVTATCGAGLATYDCLARFVAPQQKIKEGEWVAIDFGTAATGGYSYTTIVPVESGISGWGIFYLQGAKGLYFDGGRAAENTIKYACSSNSVSSLCRELEAKIGYRLLHATDYSREVSEEKTSPD